MAAVIEPKDAAAKLGAQVDEQLAQATSRIRAHDLMFGALALVALVLTYATAMVLLDKYLDLPQWLRQLSLLGLVGALGGTAYLTIVEPLRKKINPLYAARQVENTIEDAKNSVTGYVDAQQKGDLNATVKAALAGRAARSVAEADVNKAVDHRSLLYLGGVAVALFLTLVALFFVFRPAQFGSLMGRALVPFTARPIETRTQISLLKPDPAEPTVTDGQAVTVAVHIGGKVPRADGPDRVRLLVRHNPLDPNFTELNMVPGDTSRDFELRVPNHLVQNGFWYKVAAGDAETAEYKVTVRALPLFTGFRATYESPRYLRRAAETLNSPIIQGYRGTTVTLVAQTNRDASEGTMVTEPGGAAVRGAPVPGDPKALQFVFKLQDSGRYRLTYTTADGEHSADPFQSSITVTADAAPVLVIDRPEEEEVAVPANGQLPIDGKVGDDFGIDTVTLKMRLTGATERQLPDRPFLYGTSPSFRRAKDGTWPTNVDYKDSVDFAALKKDAAGLPFELKPDMVFEYWLEATDNCTEPKPNVGRSAVKRVRLTPPVVEEPKKQDLDKQKNERQGQEKKHNADQQQKLEQEPREQPPGAQQEPEPKDGASQKGGNEEGAPKKADNDPMGTKPPENKTGEPKKDGATQEGSPKEGPPKDGGEKGKDGTPNTTNPPKNVADKGDNPPKNATDPQANPMPPMNPDGTGSGPRESAPEPKTPEDRDVQQKADKLRDAIQNERSSGGEAKPNESPNDAERTPPAQPKPPMAGDPSNMSEPKPEQKPDPAANPMQQPESGAATGKPEGKVEKPSDPAAAKPTDPKQSDPNAGDKGSAPAEKREEPLGGSPGAEKPQPQEGAAQPKDPDPNQTSEQKSGQGAKPGPDQKQDPKSGSTAKPATQKSADPQPGAPDSPDKSDPAGAAGSQAKPMTEPNRGADKPGPATAPKGTPEEGKSEAGEAKPEKAPPAAAAKPMPKDGMTGDGTGAPESKPETKPEANANQSTKPNGTGAAETKPAKPDDKGTPMAGDSGTEKGTEKPQPGEPAGGAGNSAPKQKKPTEQELKELEEAARNLTSPDAQKKQEARDKLDKMIGQEKRKEAEQLANDLQSPDEKTRADANRKLEEMKKEAQKAAGQNGDSDKSGDAPKLDEKQAKDIADAVKDLQSGDEQKKQAAQQKLDKMVGEKNRKEAEQLMRDLRSDDKGTRDAAQKKLDDLKKQMEDAQAQKNANNKNGDGETGGNPKGGDRSGDAPKLDEKQAKDIADAVKDLQSGDEQKKQAAQQKLDKMVGEKNRKEAEQLMRDLRSDDKGTRDAAQKKLDDLKKQMEDAQAQKNANNKKAKDNDSVNKKGGEGAKGQEPSPEEIADLMKKAQDLQSKDDKTRERAEKELDEKLGKENREKLQQEMKGQKPGDPAQEKQLKEQMERMAKDHTPDPRTGSPGGSPPAKAAMEEDARNRLKTAELQLEQFEKKRYDEAFQKKQGFTEAEYQKFLDDYDRYVRKLRDETTQLGAGTKPPGAGSVEPGAPITVGGARKVDGRPGASSGAGGGATTEPPGFENLKDQFQKLINEKK